MKQRAKHTPAPWTVYNRSHIYHDHDERNGGWHLIADVRNQCMETADAKITDFSDAERDANAALIAAAPDLLAACRIALEYVGGADDGNCPVCSGGPDSGLEYHESCPCKSLRSAIALAESE